MDFEQLLLSELRLVPYAVGSREPTEQDVVKAMTANEELVALGYTLAPADILRLAASDSLDGFSEGVRASLGDVKAKPMYPDFPSQVMEISAAVYRFHQLVHYLTTYGLESVTGAKVIKGWLPNMTETEKTEQDEALLKTRTLALVSIEDRFIIPYKRILSKTERMDDKEREIIKACIPGLSPEQLSGVSVAFKQNLLEVFDFVFTSEAIGRQEKLAHLRALCQHTGDVWKCMDYSLTRAGFHFRTSQKRLLVRLLESYPIEDFKANLILSNKKGERVLLMLKFLDYNEYSQKKEFSKAVAALRGGRCRSWESAVKRLVEQTSPEALDMYAQRPGMMLRHLTYLMRSGYPSPKLFDKLLPMAPKLKTQTLVRIASYFSRPGVEQLELERYEEAVILSKFSRYLLERRLAANDTPLRGKKIFVDMPEFDLDRSEIRVTDKSAEGGYIRSGIAYRIPPEATAIRFFVYWNDKERVDIDLHASIRNMDGTKEQVGWNADFRTGTVVMSGDITHSDAAEYIDIDLVRGLGVLSAVTLNINLFSGYDTFREIDECFVGAMAVSKTGAEVKLYDPKNCFFTHYLTSDCRRLNYGFVDVKRRAIVFDGRPTAGGYYDDGLESGGLSLREYLARLFRSQGASPVRSAEAADLTLVMGKPSAENELSLIDNNFFMED
ncbi:MAG: hypothetical protein IJ746_06935 [Ruminococcus sp.]|nr:hypothetical protein [Ruminococcus sp.]